MILRLFAMILTIVSSSVLVADTGMLLNCRRNSSEEQFQIYINEVEKYVIYNAQNYDSYERVRRVQSRNPNEIAIRDIGLD